MKFLKNFYRAVAVWPFLGCLLKIVCLIYSDDENEDDKEDELDAEEGKADENIDEDFWAGEDENEKNEDEKQEEENLDKNQTKRDQGEKAEGNDLFGQIIRTGIFWTKFLKYF